MLDLTSLYDISKQIVDIIQNNYKQEFGPQTSLGNFSWNVQAGNDIYRLELYLPKEWQWVEYGRRPSTKMPPVEAIRQWLTAKRLVPRARNGKVPSLNGMAWAISKKIQKEGFYSPNHQGKHLLEKSLAQTNNLIEDLAMEITKMFNKEVTEDMIHIADGLKNIKGS